MKLSRLTKPVKMCDACVSALALADMERIAARFAVDHTKACEPTTPLPASVAVTLCRPKIAAGAYKPRSSGGQMGAQSTSRIAYSGDLGRRHLVAQARNGGFAR